MARSRFGITSTSSRSARSPIRRSSMARWPSTRRRRARASTGCSASPRTCVRWRWSRRTASMTSVPTCERLKRRLAALARRESVAQTIAQAVTVFNGTPGLPESFGSLHRLLERQAYRLSYWRVAASDVNYRRFFDIDGLAGVRIEEKAVFERTHALVFDLVRRGLIQGLRIDHIDGLADPRAYAAALQREIGPNFYVVAEKILEPGEALRPWPLAGTTGYEMLNLIDGIFVDAGEPAHVRPHLPRDDGLRAKLQCGVAGGKAPGAARELLLGAREPRLRHQAHRGRQSFDARTTASTRSASRSATSCAPSLSTGPTSPRVASRARIARWSSRCSRRRRPSPRCQIAVCTTSLARSCSAPSRRGALGARRSRVVERFRRRFQQLTGPVMAKSLEDTLFYRYVRFPRAERGRRRAEPLRHRPRRVPRRERRAGEDLAASADDHGDARHQARRGCARPVLSRSPRRRTCGRRRSQLGRWRRAASPSRTPTTNTWCFRRSSVPGRSSCSAATMPR